MRVPVLEDARNVGIDADERFVGFVGAIDAEQLLKLVVGNCLLEFRQRLPIGRISQRMAEVVGGAGGAQQEKEQEEEEWRAEDHGLDFGLFNTMLARC